MKTHITTLNNMAGTASLAHRRVLKVAQSIGCHEMGLSFYPLKPDYAKEIDKRLDGIIAPLNYGDIVIFQYPSWIGVNYDESFVNKIKSYRDTKLIIFVQDIQKLMFDSEQAILDMEIRTLNKADLLILPSKKMHRYLKENGLDEKPVIYQTIWDMPSDICFVDHAVTRCFHFAGNYNRFPFLAEYHGKTPIYQYDANKPDRENDDSFCWRGYFEQEKLMHELSKGGFGLVWSDDEYFDRYYVKQNCKGSYFFYEQLLADNKENTNLSADLRNVAKLLKESGSYTGALDLNYREFARIYEFVNNVGDRHNHNCYLVMVTMNTLPEQLADIEEIEKALDCMEQSIRSKIRKVDVCTRYSSMQYLIILFEPQENQIPNVMERIFMHYYELCDRENFKPQYEYIKMTEVK